MNFSPGQLKPDEPPLGDRLRALRQQHGLSLRELAEQVGVTATALHSWERGRRNPKHKHLKAFASAFKLSEQELLAEPDFAALDSPLDGLAYPRATELAAVVADCKARIAAAAGISSGRVKIVIEV